MDENLECLSQKTENLGGGGVPTMIVLVGVQGLIPIIIWFFSVFKAIKWSKMLYQFIINLFFLANIPTPGQV